MGQTLIACAARLDSIDVVGAVDQGDDLAATMDGCDVVIDFSLHHASVPAVELTASHGKALVIGTTGHSEDEKERLRAAATKVPMVWATNYSTGVNTLFWLTRKATEILGEDFDAEVIEMHHRHKQDAPSGTASTLAELLADVRKQKLDEAIRHGRVGIVGARTKSEIGMHSLRGGDVVGDHTVIFASDGERVELTHRASSRETFANGALRAAQWVVGRTPGIYTMQDVLGLS